MKLALLFCIFLFSIQSYSQKWCPPGAEWTYSFFDYQTDSGYSRYSYEKDTIYNQQLCQKLLATKVVYNSVTKETHKYKTDPFFMYSQNDTVFMYHEGVFQPTYFFNAQVGDTLVFGDIYCEDPDLIQVVDSVGITFINNDNLRFYRVKFLNFDSLPNQYLYPNPMTIIERMGNVNTFLYPQFGGCFPDWGSFNFCSYKDDEFGSYFTSNDTCWLYVDPNNVYELNDQLLIITPNPTKYNLNISSSFNGHIESVSIIGVNGVLINNIKRNNGLDVSNIDIEFLMNGLYILQIQTSNGSRYNRKFVKQDNK